MPAQDRSTWGGDRRAAVRDRFTRPAVAAVEPWDGNLEQQWDDLALACGASPFVRPGWVRAVLDAFLPAARTTVLTVRQDGRLTGVLPVVVTRRTAYSPTNWHTPHLPLVAEDPTVCRALAGAALSLPVHRVDLRFLQRDQTDLFQDVAAAGGHPVLCRTLQTSPVVSVARSWPELLTSLSGNQRKDLRRSTRRLEERGRVSWHLHDGRQGLDALLEEGFRVEASGWKGQAGTAIASSPQTARFYSSVARWAAPRDLLRINVLRVDGRAVAFDLGLQQHGVLYSLKTGYDPALRTCSPGTLNFVRLLERLCGDPQARAVEMLGHETPWKLRLASGSSEQYHLTAFVHLRRRRFHHASAQLLAAGRRHTVDRLPDAALDRLVRLHEAHRRRRTA